MFSIDQEWKESSSDVDLLSSRLFVSSGENKTTSKNKRKRKLKDETLKSDATNDKTDNQSEKFSKKNLQLNTKNERKKVIDTEDVAPINNKETCEVMTLKKKKEKKSIIQNDQDSKMEVAIKGTTDNVETKENKKNNNIDKNNSNKKSLVKSRSSNKKGSLAGKEALPNEPNINDDKATKGKKKKLKNRSKGIGKDTVVPVEETQKDIISENSSNDIYINGNGANTNLKTTETNISKFQKKLNRKLEGGHFRWINEKLYRSESSEAHRLFQEQPRLFDVYHKGFESQVEHWPVNPVDVIISYLKER